MKARQVAPHVFKTAQRGTVAVRYALKNNIPGTQAVNSLASSPHEALQVVGSSAYVLGGLAEVAAGVRDINKARKRHRYTRAGYVDSFTRLTLSQVVIGSSAVTLLGHAGVIALAPAAAVVAPIAYATLSWTKTIRRVVELIHEVKKSYYIDYHIADTAKKIENVKKKIVALQLEKSEQSEKSELTRAEGDRIDRKIEKLEKAQAELETKESLLVKFKNKEQLSPRESKVYSAIMQNQRDKIYTKAVNATISVLAATATTLVVASFYTGPIAPVLLTMGIVIGAIAGVIKLLKLASDTLDSHGANKKLSEAINEKLFVNAKERVGGRELTEKEKKLIIEKTSKKVKDKVKQQMRNELVCKTLGLDHSDKNDMELVLKIPAKDAMKILTRKHKEDRAANFKAFKSQVHRLFTFRVKEDDVLGPSQVIQPRLV